MNLFRTSFLLSLLASAFGDSIVQTYFIPCPEAQLFETFKAINSAQVSGDVTTILSVAIAANNTVIYWDHWEDGYELDPANPVQPTTEIWGMGSGPHPKLMSGQSIVLENVVPVSGNRSEIIKYDGSDRVSATLPIAITRSAYPTFPGSLLAGAVEVFALQYWGTEFLVPISANINGVNVAEYFGTTNPYEYAVYSVMAGFDETQVTYDGNTTELKQGESILLGPLVRGESLTSNRPIQVDLIAGDVDSKYELRWYAQVPSSDYSNEYFSPVAESIGSTGFWFYNPGTTAITVNYEGGNIVAPGSFTITAGGQKFIQMRSTAGPNFIQVGTMSNTTLNLRTAYYTGMRFYSTQNFYALAQIDTRLEGGGAYGGEFDGSLYDWGFPLIPSDLLTSQVLIGLGKGCTTGTCNDKDIKFNYAERSVVWVTPVEDTKIFVDYDGDGTFDEIFDVAALQAVRLVDKKSNDFDMSGAIIASFTQELNKRPVGEPVKIAVAWGQDPVRSGKNDEEALDLGTVVVPLANPFVNKRVVNVTNPDGTLDSRVLVDEVGDTIHYEITLTNVGFAELARANILVLDPLITNAGGVLSGPVQSFEPPDDFLVRGETFTYMGSYTATSADIGKKIINGVDDIENVAEVRIKTFPPVKVTVKTPIILGTISGTVFEDIDNDDDGDVPIPTVLITLYNGVGTPIATTLTDSDGSYKFANLTAGTYYVTQKNLDPTYTDVNDIDGGNPNNITVAIVGGDDSKGNDFIDERLGSISGTVTENSGSPIPFIVLVLKNSNDTVVATTLTDSNGFYIFSAVGPSNYTVEEINGVEFPLDMSDYDATKDGDEFDSDTTVDNTIKVNVRPAELDNGNNFVDFSAPSTSPSLTPSVSPSGAPSNSPTVAPSQIPSMSPSAQPSKAASAIPSSSPSGSPTTVPSVSPSAIPTSSPSGSPSTSPSVSPSATPSKVGSANPSETPSTAPSVVASAPPSTAPSNAPSSSPSHSPTVVRSAIPSPSPSAMPSKVASASPSGAPSASPSLSPTVVGSATPSTAPSTSPSKVASASPSEAPSNAPSLSPTVVGSANPSTAPSTSPSVVASASPSVAPSNLPSSSPTVFGSATPSTAPSTSPSKAASASPSEAPSTSPSLSPTVFGSAIPSRAPSISPSAFASVSPSVAPSKAPSVTPSLILTAPPVMITSSPSKNPSLAPSKSPSSAPSLPDFCEVVTTPNCTLCVPYRSPDYCNATESFPALVQNRTFSFRTPAGSADLASKGYWFHYLEDKIAGYLLSLTVNVPAPEIYCCVTNVTELASCLSGVYNNASLGGIVVKATNLHSSQGVFVLVPDTKDPNPLDLITGTHVSITDIVTQLSVLRVTKIIVEQFIGKSLPTEYKFHVINGTIAAIDVIEGRGTTCPCYAVVDTDWNRLDKFGCFEPGGIDLIDPGSQCTEIDFVTGLKKMGPVKKDMYLCFDIEEPKPCILQEMIDIALALGDKIGVAIRVDMFVVDDRVYVQEYSVNPMNGLRHCAAKRDAKGCIDSCFVGRLWDAAGGPYGGKVTQVPTILNGFGALSPKDQCGLLKSKPVASYKPKC